MAAMVMNIGVVKDSAVASPMVIMPSAEPAQIGRDADRAAPDIFDRLMRTQRRQPDAHQPGHHQQYAKDGPEK